MGLLQSTGIRIQTKEGHFFQNSSVLSVDKTTNILASGTTGTYHTNTPHLAESNLIKERPPRILPDLIESSNPSQNLALLQTPPGVAPPSAGLPPLDRPSHESGQRTSTLNDTDPQSPTTRKHRPFPKEGPPKNPTPRSHETTRQSIGYYLWAWKSGFSKGRCMEGMGRRMRTVRNAAGF